MRTFDQEVLSLAELGKATKQYLQELAAAQAKGEDTEEFEICACTDITQFDKDKCEGCKIYGICQQMHKIA